MANWKKAIKELENLNKDHTDYGQIAEHDLYSGRADDVIDHYYDKQNKKWKVEFAKELIEEKKKENEKEVEYDMSKR